MYDLQKFGLPQMIEFSKSIRLLGQHSRSMEDSASQVVNLLFDSFRIPETDQPALALVRCFKTQPYAELPPFLRGIAAAAMHGGQPSESMQCLALLATRGIETQWNTRHTSAGHQAIPLATAEMIAQAPMIARLIEQMGLSLAHIAGAQRAPLTSQEANTFDVFHVEFARGSIFVPAQEAFVKPYGIRSVLGFGALLPNGDLFFVILFSRVHIAPETAEMFRTLALGVKLVLLSQSSTVFVN